MLRFLALLAAVLVVQSCALDFSGYREGNRDAGATGGGTATGGSGGSSGARGSGGTDGGKAGAGGAGGTGGDHCNPLAPQTPDPTHPACPAAYDCLPSATGATHCVPSGGTSSGGVCQTSAQCLPGLGCVNFSATVLQCADYCVHDSDCSDGGFCNGIFSSPLYDGSTRLKFCQ